MDFHQDNAPSHSSLIVTVFLAKHGTKVIAQPTYSPDLTLYNFFLLQKLKYPLPGTRHESIQAIKRNSLKELRPYRPRSIKSVRKIGLSVGILVLAPKEPILKAIIKICIKIHKNVVFINRSG